MTVAQFIEWLKTQDQSARVDVLVHSDGRSYYDQGGNVRIEHFDADKAECFEYYKYTDGQATLTIGTKDN